MDNCFIEIFSTKDYEFQILKVKEKTNNCFYKIFKRRKGVVEWEDMNFPTNNDITQSDLIYVVHEDKSTISFVWHSLTKKDKIYKTNYCEFSTDKFSEIKHFESEIESDEKKLENYDKIYYPNNIVYYDKSCFITSNYIFTFIIDINENNKYKLKCLKTLNEYDKAHIWHNTNFPNIEFDKDCIFNICILHNIDELILTWSSRDDSIIKLYTIKYSNGIWSQIKEVQEN